MFPQLTNRLKSSGLSVTKPRLAVFEYLSQHHPVTTDAVIRQLSDVADRASIYRTLSVFREHGIIQDIVARGQRMIELTDTFDRHHHHISCMRCGVIKTIDDHGIERRLEAMAEANGFELVRHQIEVAGLCLNCRQIAYK